VAISPEALQLLRPLAASQRLFFFIEQLYRCSVFARNEPALASGLSQDDGDIAGAVIGLETIAQFPLQPIVLLLEEHRCFYLSAIGDGLAAAFSSSVFGLLKTGQCLKIVVGVAHSLARKFLFCCPAPQAQRLFMRLPSSRGL
jgi:hypothetical protein